MEYKITVEVIDDGKRLLKRTEEGSAPDTEFITACKSAVDRLVITTLRNLPPPVQTRVNEALRAQYEAEHGVEAAREHEASMLHKMAGPLLDALVSGNLTVIRLPLHTHEAPSAADPKEPIQ